MKKPYTLIYTEAVGYARTRITYYKRIETDNLTDAIKDKDVCFIFEGHPPLEGEFKTES